MFYNRESQKNNFSQRRIESKSKSRFNFMMFLIICLYSFFDCYSSNVYKFSKLNYSAKFDFSKFI